MRKCLSILFLLLAAVTRVSADGTYFNYNPSDYNQTMTVYARLVDANGQEVHDEKVTQAIGIKYYLAAFIDNETRSTPRLVMKAVS